jgi:hypothetical protein
MSLKTCRTTTESVRDMKGSKRLRTCLHTDVLMQAVEMVTLDLSRGTSVRMALRRMVEKEPRVVGNGRFLCGGDGTGPVVDHVHTLLGMMTPGRGVREVVTGLQLLCKLWKTRNKDEVREAVHGAGGHVALVDRVLELGVDLSGDALQVMQQALQCLILM